MSFRRLSGAEAVFAGEDMLGDGLGVTFEGSPDWTDGWTATSGIT